MSQYRQLGSAFLYGFCSTTMAFVNNFNYPVFMVACQMLFSIIVLELLRIFKILSVPEYTFSRGLDFLFPSLFYAAHSVLSLSALSGMNIPMYGVIKRCSPIAILLLGPILLRKSLPSSRLIIAILFLSAGCVVAGFGDLAFDFHAYAYGATSVFTQALYLILVQKKSQQSQQNLDAFETLHLNSFNTFPMLLIFSLLSGELLVASTYFVSTAVPSFYLTFFVVISLGTLLNFSLFLCTSVNSALTTSVVGVLKSIIQTVIGFFTFGGISLNLFTIAGIVMNTLGGVMYSWAKVVEFNSKTENKIAVFREDAEAGLEGEGTGSVHVTENGSPRHMVMNSNPS